MAKRAPPRDLLRDLALHKLQTMLPKQLDDHAEDVAAEEYCIKKELRQDAALLYHGTDLHVLIFDASILRAFVPNTGDVLPETGCQVFPTESSPRPENSTWRRFNLQDHPPKSPSDSGSAEQKYLRRHHLALYRSRQYGILFYDPDVLDITWAGWKEGSGESAVVLMPADGLRVVPKAQLNQSNSRPMWIRFKLKTEASSAEPTAKVHPKPATVSRPVPDHPDTLGDPRHIARSASASRSAGDWPPTAAPLQEGCAQNIKRFTTFRATRDSPRRACNGGFLSAAPRSNGSSPETGVCGACPDNQRRHSGDAIRDPQLRQLNSDMNRINLKRRSTFAFERNAFKLRPESGPIITDVLAGHESVPIRRSSANMPPGMAEAIAITEPVTPTRTIAPSLPGEERGSTHQPRQSGVPETRPSALTALLMSPIRPTPPVPTSPLLRAALESGRYPITSPSTSRTGPTISPRSGDKAKTNPLVEDSAKFKKMEVDDSDEKMDVDDTRSSEKPVTRSKSQESRARPSTRSNTPQKPTTSKSDSLRKQALDGSSKNSRKPSETDSPKVGRSTRARKGSESSETETDSDAVQTRTRVTRGAKERKGSKSEPSENSGSERDSSADKAKKAAKGTPRKQTKPSTSKAAEGTSGDDTDVKGTPRKTRGTDPKSEEPSKKSSADTPVRKSSRLNK